MDLSIRVIKEPRGFIRIIQCVMAIIAFATTVDFDTICKFSITCPPPGEKEEFEYELGYPFSNSVLKIPNSCGSNEKDVELTLPFDYTSSAAFYVATGVLAFLYTIFTLVVYIFFHQMYANNPKLPVIDMGITAVLSVFWLAGSSAWAQGVADLKFYLHPDTVFNFLGICKLPDVACETTEDGTYGLLNASLIAGFANFLLWSCSLWFIYKETVFFSSEETPQPQPNQAQMPKGIGKV
ncbi:synaptophysin-like isoform X2 [Uloborus diversus]|nr:synaptophysin-like isoform X2 [Uloborus diversus]